MNQQKELQSLDRHGHKIGLRTFESVPIHPTYDKDVVALARSGKKQVLERRFGFVSMTGFSCGLMCTWEGILVAFLLGFQNGGPAGLIYGFFVTWLGTLSVFIAMGELSSMIPTAGGQYHWVSILAPESCKRFLGYVTGWITVAGWVAGTTATAFFVSSLLQALIVLNNPSYTPLGWQGTLLFWAVLLVCVATNTVLSKALPTIEVMVLILHILGFFAILIPLLYLAPKDSAVHVFTTFYNRGGWSTQALSFFIGLNGNAVAFVGTDGAIHMSEEIQNAPENVPRSMILSTVINGLLAFGMLLAVLFCAGDVSDSIANAPNGYPFVAIFAAGVGSNAGATAMASIVLLLELCSATAGLAAASRMMWSFARDRGLPGSAVLSRVGEIILSLGIQTKKLQVNPKTTVPLAAIVVVFVCAALIGLINIGSSTAFNDVVSLVLEGFYSSYLIACSILLYRRLRGDISDPDIDNTSQTPYQWGPWRLKGLLGVVNNVVACMYLILIAFFSYWPTAIPVTADTMNYSSLVLGVVAIASMIYYFAWARKTYHGPIVEVEVQCL